MGARPGGWASADPQTSPLIRGSIRFRGLVNELLQAGVMDGVRDVRAGPDQGGVSQGEPGPCGDAVEGDAVQEREDFGPEPPALLFVLGR